VDVQVVVLAAVVAHLPDLGGAELDRLADARHAHLLVVDLPAVQHEFPRHRALRVEVGRARPAAAAPLGVGQPGGRATLSGYCALDRPRRPRAIAEIGGTLLVKQFAAPNCRVMGAGRSFGPSVGMVHCEEPGRDRSKEEPPHACYEEALRRHQSAGEEDRPARAMQTCSSGRPSAAFSSTSVRFRGLDRRLAGAGVRFQAVLAELLEFVLERGVCGRVACRVRGGVGTPG
jgi:hypothetical protein